ATPYSRIASYDGGNQGWMLRALIGYTKPKAKGSWNVELGYRYLESDAFLDIMPDSDFHLGGTNAKGYLLGGRYAIFNNLVISGKWMSGNEISGPPLAIDVLQVDLTASF
ncbi:MAG: putative porin, partial [Polymorphobacter sp.]